MRTDRASDRGVVEAPARDLIALSGVCRHYGEGETLVRALDDVDLRVSAGEFVAIMGPSGSGKSTAMNVLGCLDTPTAGTYHFLGVDVGALDPDQRALLRRQRLGFVFQGFNLLPRMTALENVELPLLYQGVAPARRRQRALDVMDSLGLADRALHQPSALSGGQQQRVAIARAIVSRPEVLLADVPTGNLDSSRGAEIMGLLEGLNQDLGLTILMVTHDAAMARFAERHVHFFDGRIVRDGAASSMPRAVPEEASC